MEDGGACNGLDEAVLHGVAGGRAARPDADFGEDRAEVRVDSAGTKAEPIGDPSVGQAGCDQLQDVHLSGRQLIRKRFARDSHQQDGCIAVRCSA